MPEHPWGGDVKTRSNESQRTNIHVGVRNFGQVLVKYWRSVVVIALVGLLLGVVLGTQTTTQYDSTTTLYISIRASSGGATGDLLQGSNFAQAAMPSYTDVVTTILVLQRVADELEIEVSPAELRTMLNVVSPSESVLLEITATHEDPHVAMHVADTTGAVFTNVVENDLEVSNSDHSSPIHVRTVDPASVPAQPASSPVIRNGIIGGFLGIFVGLGLAALREQFDTRVHSAKDLERATSLPVLGRIPEEEKIKQHPLIVHPGALAGRAEAFRMLRTNLQFLCTPDQPETLVVTSAMPGAGKTHVIANLAIALDESGARVTLIDADLRNPRIANVMGIEGSAGLSDVLIDRVELSEVLQPWGLQNLQVLPAGQIPPNPSELLGSLAMRNLLSELEAVSDYVLVDTPPVLPVTDAAVASTFASGTLLVVALNQSKGREVFQALESLKTVDSRFLGFVTNRDASTISTGHGRPAVNYGSVPLEETSRKLKVRS